MVTSDTIPLVYIAGPYSRPDPVANTHVALTAASELYGSGAVVPLVPHLTLLWQLVDPQPIEFWYGYDLQILRHCDAVLVLPGDSHGVRQEVREASRLGIPVFECAEDVLKWAQARSAS